MSELSIKSEESVYRSPTNIEQAHGLDYSSVADDIDNDISPESISVISRKESHRASERKRRERLSMSMNALDNIIKQTRKFANKKNVKLDKNSIIEHAIAYIKELQQVNELYLKRLEEATVQINSLQQLLMVYNQSRPISSLPGNTQIPTNPLLYNPDTSLLQHSTPYQPTVQINPSLPKPPYYSVPQPSFILQQATTGSTQNCCFDSLVKAAVGVKKEN